MKYVILTTAFWWGLYTPVYSQQHATCDDAISVTASSYGPISPKGWADPSLCDASNKNMYFGQSHMVVWFSFIVPYDTLLTFQIVPQNPADDFDFILFKAGRGDFCQKEKQRNIQPIRTNFAKPQVYSNGLTGLSIKSADAFIAPGYNSPYSSAVPVKKGERYYLAVDNYINDKAGFTLKLPLRFTTNSNIVTDTAPVKAPPIITSSNNANFYIHVLDSANHSIKANLIIDIVQGKSFKVDTSTYALKLGKYQHVKIRANAKGYMPYQSSYSTTADTSTVTFSVQLEPIKSSRKIILRDIQFKGDSPDIMPESKPALDYVLQFLLSNQNVKIIIKGYTNDPYNEQSEKYDQVLSEKRANAVKDYLSTHGIDKNRINCIGYGNTRMLYAHPSNKDQQTANRRVEIEVR